MENQIPPNGDRNRAQGKREEAVSEVWPASRALDRKKFSYTNALPTIRRFYEHYAQRAAVVSGRPIHPRRRLLGVGETWRDRWQVEVAAIVTGTNRAFVDGSATTYATAKVPSQAAGAILSP
ncbi:hypothetical protein [Bradyrhizobium sp. JYMT SZCCT0428]|uniref:hypothetical protein n=1 Tax=Bradyrhizobium sp. JYMT SZCCT0428 TaxID=2807673 RepID=UPI001BA85A95|nr:hypothetical protein [Bradyrhizobium sp. JYMT SZCCT0428]MBR1153679.1 hypothetical protein [Bradyrhizobium sp. JYMT SZCCT0428]